MTPFIYGDNEMSSRGSESAVYGCAPHRIRDTQAASLYRISQNRSKISDRVRLPIRSPLKRKIETYGVLRSKFAFKIS